jgi:hypothetical protein
MLTQGYLKELFKYHNDGYLIRKIKTSNSVKIGDTAGCDTGNGYKKIVVCGKPYLSHRLIFFWHYGFWPKEIDHINGAASDNRIENLRAANRNQNGKNRALSLKNTSGFTGVVQDKIRNKWIAQITVNRKNIFLGRFENMQEAINKRKEAEIFYFKDWARNDCRNEQAAK